MTTPSIFYVKDKSLNRVAAQFLYYGGQPVPDPNNVTAQSTPIFDANGNPITNANPNGYLIVPADYSIQAVINGPALEVKNAMSVQVPMTGPTGVVVMTSRYSTMSHALIIMVDDFTQGGPQDLQRSYDGNQKATFVSAFTDAASFNLGLFSAYAGIPLSLTETAGGGYNALNSIINVLEGKKPLNTGGPYFNSTLNAASIEAGYNFGQNLPGAAVSLADPATIVLEGGTDDPFSSATVTFPTSNEFQITQDWKSGGSQTVLFNPSSSISYEYENFAAADGQGTPTSEVITYTNGLSMVATFQQASLSMDVAQMDTDYTGADGTGSADGYVFDFDDGNSIALGAGTSSTPSYSTSTSVVNVGLTTSSGLNLGTLTFDASNDTDEFKLTDGLTLTLPGISGNMTVAPDTTLSDSPYQVLGDYLAELGDSSDASNLSALNYAYLNPTGTAYDVTGTVTGYANGDWFVAYTPTGGPSAQISGENNVDYDGYNLPAYNYILVANAASADLTRDTISNIQALTLGTGGSASAELSAAEFHNLGLISGTGTLTITTGGSVNLNDIDDSGTFNLTAQSWDGTQLTGNNQYNQTLTASLYGDDTLTAGSGQYDVLIAGEGVDTLTGGNNSDYFEALNGLAYNSSLTGNSGHQNYLLASGDLSQGSISGITWLQVGTTSGNATVGLTQDQLDGFTIIDTVATTGTINAMQGGTYSLQGDTIYGYAYSSGHNNNDVALNAQSDDFTTLIGNDTSSGSGAASILSASGNGNDTLTAYGHAKDSLSASGNGNDTLTAGDGSGDGLSASGNGNDILTAGNGNNDSLSASGSGTVSLTAGYGNNDQLSANGDGYYSLDAGYGNNDQLTITGDDSSASVGSGNNDVLTATGDGNTLSAGNGTNDTLTATGSFNTLNAGSDALLTVQGGDNTLYAGSSNTFDLYDEDNTAIASGGDNLFNIEGSSSGGGFSLAGTTINGGGGGNNALDDVYGGNDGTVTLDITGTSISNIQQIEGVDTLIVDSASAAEMAQIQSASFTRVEVEGPGTYSLASLSSSDVVDMYDATTEGGVTLISNNAAGASLGADGAGDTLTLGSGAGDSAALSGDNSTATAGSGAGDILSAAGNNDTLHAGSGGDTLDISSGGNTNNSGDSAYGGSGADTFNVTSNGAYLQGNGGGDTYNLFFTTGDTVIDNYHTDSNTSTLVFQSLGSTATFTSSNTVVTQQGENLVLTESGTTNQVTVENYFEGADWQLGINFEEDSTSWNAATVSSKLQTPVTLSDDTTTTVSTSGNTINSGNGGNITATTSSANTVALSGSGNTVADTSSTTENIITDAAASSDNTLNLSGTGDTATLAGSDDTVALSGASMDTVTLSGTGSAVSDNSGSTINSITLNGSTETATLAGSGDTVTLAGSSDTATLSGTSGTAILSGTGDSVSLSGASSESITFDPDALGTLLLQSAQDFTGTVAGLASGDGIDLANFNFADGATISSVTGMGTAGTDTVLTITDNGVSTQIALLNQFANQFVGDPSAYTLTADSTQPNAGTLLQLAAAH